LTIGLTNSKYPTKNQLQNSNLEELFKSNKEVEKRN